MCITLKSTPSKYEKTAEELAPPLFELLNELDSLEQEIFARNRAMDEEKPALNIPSHQTHPKRNELISEYRTRFEAIIDKRVTEKLKARGFANSFGKPTRYPYIKSGAFSAEFTMRKEDTASIVVHYNSSLDKKHKFVLRLIDGIWLIDAKYYGFENENIWHSDSI